MLRFILMIRRIARRFSEDNLSVYSAQAAFFIIVSMIPFIMLLLSSIRYMIPDGKDAILNTLMMTLPKGLQPYAIRTINELFSSASSGIISLSAVISLWTASKGIMGLERGFHVIHRVHRRGNYVIRRLRCTLYTLAFLASILISIGLLVFGPTLSALIVKHLPILSTPAKILYSFRMLISLLVFLVVFSLGYKFLAGVSCSLLQLLPGVIFSTLGWMLFSAGFSIYIVNFSNYTYLYGSLGALILLMLWIYFCILILMIGAELNIYLNPEILVSAEASPSSSDGK